MTVDRITVRADKVRFFSLIIAGPIILNLALSLLITFFLEGDPYTTPTLIGVLAATGVLAVCLGVLDVRASDLVLTDEMVSGPGHGAPFRRKQTSIRIRDIDPGFLPGKESISLASVNWPLIVDRQDRSTRLNSALYCPRQLRDFLECLTRQVTGP